MVLFDLSTKKVKYYPFNINYKPMLSSFYYCNKQFSYKNKKIMHLGINFAYFQIWLESGCLFGPLTRTVGARKWVKSSHTNIAGWVLRLEGRVGDVWMSLRKHTHYNYILVSFISYEVSQCLANTQGRSKANIFCNSNCIQYILSRECFYYGHI